MGQHMVSDGLDIDSVVNSDHPDEAEEALEIGLPLGGMGELQSTILASLASLYEAPQKLAERMGYVQSHVTDDFMEGDFYQLWRLLTRYYPLAGGLPSPDALEEMLEGTARIPMPDKVKLSETYRELVTRDISEASFKIAVVRIAERWRDDQYSTLLAEANKIHHSSHQVGREALSGFADSIAYLKEKMAHVEHLARTESAAEGDMNQEVSEMLDNYMIAKAGGAAGVMTGFPELDALTHGMHPGELWLCAGYTSEGKSKVAYNMAYAACYLQGKNILFGTNEATRSQVRLNMIVRHSHHPKFDHARGLRYSDVRYGSLSKEDEWVLDAVAKDIRQSTDRGRCYIFQMPNKASPDYIAEVIYRQRRVAPIGLVVIDYLGLMSSGTRRTDRRQELDDMLLAVKRIAIEYEVPIVSPWQMSRTAWLEAVRSGKYTRASLADTSQAEKTSDVILSILKDDEMPNAIKCQVLKNRDGESDIDFNLYTDFTTSFVGSTVSHSNLLDVA